MNLNPVQTHSKELAKLTVPDWVQGVWRRDHIRTDGALQENAFVVWVQTPLLFADLRAPLGEEQRAEGFAGWLEVEDQICRWHRPIDLHPGPEGADQGVMFVDGDLMLETGLFRNYLEQYRRIASPLKSFAATRGGVEIRDGRPVFAKDGRLELVVAVDGHVIHALRNGQCGLGYYHYDEATGRLDAKESVSLNTVTGVSSQDWCVWTDELEDGGRLLELIGQIA